MIKPVNNPTPEPTNPHHKAPPTNPNLNSPNSQSSTNSLNALGNALWLATYALFSDPSDHGQPDASSYAQFMAAINEFMSTYPTPPANNQYVADLWGELNAPGHGETLAQLAADYGKNGYTASGYEAYCSYISDPNSSYWSFTNSINQFGSLEGGYLPFQQTLTAGALDQLFQDLPLNPNSPRNLSNFLEDVETVWTQISNEPPASMDGVSLALYNLLSAPLDAQGDSLATLAKAGNTSALQGLLQSGQLSSGNIQTVLNLAYRMEFGSPPP